MHNCMIEIIAGKLEVLTNWVIVGAFVPQEGKFVLCFSKEEAVKEGMPHSPFF